MANSLQDEEVWLERFETGQVVGFWLLDAEGRTVQRADVDGSMREIIQEYLRERIRELALSEPSAERTLVFYPLRDE